MYRNRVWNAGEKSFLGWERKRGLLCQFNDFIVNGVNSFRVNTIANEEKNICNKIKYVITLDSDIDLEASRKNLFTKIYAGLRRNRFIYKCCIRYLL